MTDRRLSLEAAILRQSLKEASTKWVKSEQMIADCLAEVLPGGYARKAVISNLRALGPDDRAPPIRGRKLVGPEKLAANKEVDDLNAKIAKCVKQELHDDTDVNGEIPTWPEETHNYVGECFYDDKGEKYDETEYAEAFYMDDATDNYPMDRSGAQRTIQIPDQLAVLLQFCALAVHGVCLSMSPTAVTSVFIIADIMQPKQSDDEDFCMAPMEVDSSSSDNLSRAE
eukprot:9502433-Pyramimonas_sp.AAC.1